MKFTSIILLLILSLTGHAKLNHRAHFEFSYQYDHPTSHTFTDTLIVNSDGSIQGRIDSFGQDCVGQVEITSDNSLNIFFDGMNGPGSGGGCHNASLIIDLGDTGFDSIEVGDLKEVTFYAIRFFNQPRAALLKRVK